MGTTTSCNECKCHDRSQTPTGTPSKVMMLADEEEEVCDPEDTCKSWQPMVVAQRSAIPLKDIPTPCRKSKFVGKGIDAERVLSFRLLPGDGFGLQLAEATSGTAAGVRFAKLLVVANVEDESSPFAQTADGHRGVFAGDVIAEVNGRRGAASELRNVLQQAVAVGGHRQIDLVVRPRPSAFDVELRREGRLWESLGINLVIDTANPGCALVQGLRNEGLVPKWNETHGSLRICAGDLVTEVNDLRENATAMVKEIQEGRKGSLLRFRVQTSIVGQAVARHVTCKAALQTEAEAKAQAEAEAQRAHLRAAAEVRAAEAARRRLCAESAEQLHSHISAREQFLRHEVASLPMEAIAWDTADNGEVMDAPPPLRSPAQTSRSRETTDALSNGRWVDGVASRPAGDQGCFPDEAEFSSEWDRIAPQVLPCRRQTNEANVENRPSASCQQHSEFFDMPWGVDVASWFELSVPTSDNSREQDMLRGASMNSPASGAWVPAFGAQVSSDAQESTQRRSAWV